MKPVALAKARDHLDLARDAVDRLNLENGFKAFEQAWSQVVAELSRFYSKLEQGSKGCNVSTPWFGQKKNVRKADELMAYLHHARNCEEHGLDYITQRSADSMSLHFPPTNEMTFGVEMMIDDEGVMHVRNPTVKSPNGGVDKVEVLNPRVDLVAVRDRGVTYVPPAMHNAMPIVDASPVDCAQLAISYLECVFAEASGLPRH